MPARSKSKKVAVEEEESEPESETSSTRDRQPSDDEYLESTDDSDEEDEGEDEAEPTDVDQATSKTSKRKRVDNPDSEEEKRGKEKQKRSIKSESPHAVDTVAKGVGKRRPKANRDHAIWTVGYEALDKSLGIIPGQIPKWPPFTLMERKNKKRPESQDVWQVHKNGKRWLRARFKAYKAPVKSGSEHEVRRAKFDGKEWRASLTSVYHALWGPDLDFSKYGDPHAAKNRASEYLGKLRRIYNAKQHEIVKPESPTIDSFLAKLFSDRRRPRAYDLWASSMKNDPKLKEMMDEELENVYGSADGRSLNERMAARRAIFERLPEEVQLDCRKRAEKWKADASKPESADMASWIPAAFNALGDACDRKAHWPCITMVGGKGPDGELYYFIDESSAHTRGPVVPLLSREWGAIVRRGFQNYIAEIESYLTKTEVQGKDVQLLQLSTLAGDEKGSVRPPDLEHDSSFTSFPPEVSQESIRSEATRFLNESYLKVPVEFRGKFTKPPWNKIAQADGEKELAEFYDVKRIHNPAGFTDPSMLSVPLVKELALHLLRSCHDPNMDDDKRFRWAHQVDDKDEELIVDEDSEDEKFVMKKTTKPSAAKGKKRASSEDDEGSATEGPKRKTTKPSIEKGKKRASSEDDEGSANESPKRKKSRSTSTSTAAKGMVKAVRRVGPANLPKTKNSKAKEAVRKSPRKTKKVAYMEPDEEDHSAEWHNLDDVPVPTSPRRTRLRMTCVEVPTPTKDMKETYKSAADLSDDDDSPAKSKTSDKISIAEKPQPKQPSPPKLSSDDDDDLLIQQGLRAEAAQHKPPSAPKPASANGGNDALLAKSNTSDKISVAEKPQHKQHSPPTLVSDDDGDLPIQQHEEAAQHQQPSAPKPASADGGNGDKTIEQASGQSRGASNQHTQSSPPKSASDITDDDVVIIQQSSSGQRREVSVSAYSDIEIVEPPHAPAPARPSTHTAHASNTTPGGTADVLNVVQVEKRRPQPKIGNGPVFGHSTSIFPTFFSGHTPGDLVIRQIFQQPQPALNHALISNMTKTIGVNKVMTKMHEFKASGGWNSSDYETDGLVKCITLTKLHMNLQKHLWTKPAPLLMWTEGINFDNLHPVAAEFLRKLCHSAEGMPCLSQWNEFSPGIQIEVIREGVGAVVNGITQWLRLGCKANANVQFGGLWSALRTVDWAVRVSQLTSPIISPQTPYILVPWLQAALRSAHWVIRTRYFTTSLRDPIIREGRDLFHSLRKAWELYAGSVGATDPSYMPSYLHPCWNGEDELPEPIKNDLDKLQLYTSFTELKNLVIDEAVYKEPAIRAWLERRGNLSFQCYDDAQLGEIVFIFMAHVISTHDTTPAAWFVRFGQELGAALMILARKNNAIIASLPNRPGVHGGGRASEKTQQAMDNQQHSAERPEPIMGAGEPLHSNVDDLNAARVDSRSSNAAGAILNITAEHPVAATSADRPSNNPSATLVKSTPTVDSTAKTAVEKPLSHREAPAHDHTGKPPTGRDDGDDPSGRPGNDCSSTGTSETANDVVEKASPSTAVSPPTLASDFATTIPPATHLETENIVEGVQLGANVREKVVLSPQGNVIDGDSGVFVDKELSASVNASPPLPNLPPASTTVAVPVHASLTPHDHIPSPISPSVPVHTMTPTSAHPPPNELPPSTIERIAVAAVAELNAVHRSAEQNGQGEEFDPSGDGLSQVGRNSENSSTIEPYKTYLRVPPRQGSLSPSLGRTETEMDELDEDVPATVDPNAVHADLVEQEAGFHNATAELTTVPPAHPSQERIPMDSDEEEEVAPTTVPPASTSRDTSRTVDHTPAAPRVSSSSSSRDQSPRNDQDETPASNVDSLPLPTKRGSVKSKRGRRRAPTPAGEPARRSRRLAGDDSN